MARDVLNRPIAARFIAIGVGDHCAGIVENNQLRHAATKIYARPPSATVIVGPA